MTQKDTPTLLKEISQLLSANRASHPHAATPDKLSGSLPAEFYEHLHQAQLAYNKIHVPLQMKEDTTPLIGALRTRFRRSLHTLVLFYVNQVAARQTNVNTHLLHALRILAEAHHKNG